MADKRNFMPTAAAIAAAMLATFPLPLEIATASVQQLKDIQPTAVIEPAALYITLCLWSKERPAVMCREVPIAPGAAGPEFANMKACQDGQEEALRRWRAEAGPVFGFTDMAGDGYRIEGKRCGLAVGSPTRRE